MFVGEIRPLHSHVETTIDGNNNPALGIGTVHWRWKDDSGKGHAYLIQILLYFPDSPINILSITEFTNQMNDDNRSEIMTFRKESTFFWDHNKYARTIVNPPSNLLDMSINDGFSLHSYWTGLLGTCFGTIKAHCHCLALSQMPDKNLDCTIFDSSSPAIEIVKSLFHVGDTFLYNKDGHNTYAKVIQIHINNDGKLLICIKTAARDEINTTRESR